MFKKICLIIVLLLCQQTFAVEIPIKITPAKEYSTCKNQPKEGDFLYFVTIEDTKEIKAGTEVVGLLTERKENGFSSDVASFYVEQFKIDKKNLNGIVYKKGNEHSLYFEYFDWLVSIPLKIFSPENSFVRGGEAFLIPHKDVFTLYLKDN